MVFTKNTSDEIELYVHLTKSSFLVLVNGPMQLLSD